VSLPRWRKGAVAAGLVVVAGYLVVGGLTLRVSGRHVRPLFDSFANAPYGWVCPPASLKAGNITPNPALLGINLTPAGSVNLSVATDDGQILFSMALDEIPAHGADTSVLAKITPLCAGKVGAVPAGYSAAGNAYRYALAYRPSGVAVTRTDKPGNVIVRPPTTADALAYSADNGKTWQLLHSFHSGTSIGASFTAPGVYLALQRGTGNGLAPAASGGSGTSPFLIGLLVALVAALIVGAVEFIRRRRP
jgi:hypothetical protein